MKRLLITIIILSLTGCASQCQRSCLLGFIGPGNSGFDAVANYHDSRGVGSGGYRSPTYITTTSGTTIAVAR